MSMSAIGIDLGTTNTVVSFFIDGQPNVLALAGVENYIPTCIFFRTETDYVIGSAAEALGKVHPNAVIKNFKTHINNDVISGNTSHYTVIAQDEAKFSITPQRAVTCFLTKLISKIEEHIRSNIAFRDFIMHSESETLIDNVIITVPTKFEASAKKVLEDTARRSIPHVKCTLDEPTAAAVCSTFKYGRDFGNVLVYDFGGGTFDISVLEHTPNGYVNVVELNGGDPNLGGNDITNDIVKNAIKKINEKAGRVLMFPEICENITTEEYTRLAIENNCHIGYKKARANYYAVFDACNNLKHQLSLNNAGYELTENFHLDCGVNDDSVPVQEMFSLTYKRDELERITEERINLTMSITKEVIENAKYRNVRIDRIILTGGSSQFPMIINKISCIANESGINAPIRSDDFATMVAKGASIEAASATHISNCRNLDIGFHAFNKTENLCDYFYTLYSSDYKYTGERVDITMPVSLTDGNRKYLEEIFFYTRNPRLHNKEYLTREVSPVTKYYSRLDIPFPDINSLFGKNSVPESTLCRITVFLDENYNFKVEQVSLDVNDTYRDIRFAHIR